MGDSRRVLSERNGNWNAQALFVAEAPGRLGAQLTGVPLFGDRTGDRFQDLLDAMGWDRSAVFVTNAVLCNPRDSEGNNDKPLAAEIANCSNFLRRTITVVDPTLVIALGRVALEALGAIQDHRCSIAGHCGKVVSWGERYLGVLYHPSPRTQAQRTWKQQVTDARSIAEFAQRQLGIRLAN